MRSTSIFAIALLLALPAGGAGAAAIPAAADDLAERPYLILAGEGAGDADSPYIDRQDNDDQTRQRRITPLPEGEDPNRGDWGGGSNDYGRNGGGDIVDIITDDERSLICRFFGTCGGILDDDGGAKHKGNGKSKAKKGLPPGIAMNLERGKPLPPGIRRTRMPDSLQNQLIPRDGATWRIVEDDVFLVEEGSDVILDVLRDVVRDR